MTVGSVPIAPAEPTLVAVKRFPRIVIAAVLALLIAGATAAVALGATGRHDGVARPILPAEPLALVVGGIPTMLATDQAIPLGADLSATLRLVRDTGTTRRLLIALTAADGSFPTGATVRVAAHMRYMDHGSFDAVAMPDGTGRLVAVLPFAMPGEWEARLDVTGAGAPASLTLDVDLTR